MTVIELLHRMLRIRVIELEIAKRYSEGQMRQPIHLSIGQEAAAVGVCASLGPNDLMVGSHRSHAWYLAKGGSLNALIAELYGKQTGCSRGHGGSMHLVDWSCGFAGSTSIVAGSIPVGVGLAWAKRLRKEPGCVVITFGDAAVEQGVFHESANFAALHRLPVLFVCENNGMSCYTPILMRQPRKHFRKLASAHEMAYWRCLLQDSVSEIAARTKGMLSLLPAVLEIECARHFEHCGPAREMETPDWDPLRSAAIDNVLAQEIVAAFRFAEDSPDPEQVGMYAD